MNIEIGEHVIGIADDAPVEHGREDLCVMAIGLGQPIGNCVVREPDGGRYVSATKLHGYGRLTVGAYVEIDPDREIASAGSTARIATDASLSLALIAVIIMVSISRSAISTANAIATIARRSVKSYIRREITSQWRFVVGLSVPIAGMAAWILSARGG